MIKPQPLLPPYHQRFSHLHPQLLQTTREFWRAHPLRGSQEDQLWLFRNWLKCASEVYQVPPPKLDYQTDTLIYRMTGGGCYGDGTIHLFKLSVTTLFHEFRHHLQSELALAVSPEPDARAWSLSLFYQTRRRLFTKSVEAGKIAFVTSEQLNTPERRARNA